MIARIIALILRLGRKRRATTPPNPASDRAGCEVCDREARLLARHCHPQESLRWEAKLCTECSREAFVRVSGGELVFEAVK